MIALKNSALKKKNPKNEDIFSFWLQYANEIFVKYTTIFKFLQKSLSSRIFIKQNRGNQGGGWAWFEFIPLEWFYSNGMILFQWNDSALKKIPYKRLNLKILEYILEWFYSNGMILFQWNDSALKKIPYKRLN